MSLNKELVISVEINSEVELFRLVLNINKILKPKTCILLEGELASGKTTLVRAFAESYGLKAASSPTFSLNQIYENSKIKIHHFDLYRLNSLEEIETSGLFEVFQEKNAVVFIEWPSRVPESSWPLDWPLFEISINKVNEEKRTFTLSRLFS